MLADAGTPWRGFEFGIAWDRGLESTFTLDIGPVGENLHAVLLCSWTVDIVQNKGQADHQPRLKPDQTQLAGHRGSTRYQILDGRGSSPEFRLAWLALFIVGQYRQLGEIIPDRIEIDSPSGGTQARTYRETEETHFIFQGQEHVDITM